MGNLGHLLIVERRTTIEDRTLIVVHIITQTVVERHTQCEALPVEIKEDISIDIRIGVANDGLVALINLMVIVQIIKDHVTSLEILLSTSLVNQVEACGLCIGCGREHALGLVTIEHTHGVAYRGQDIVLAINRRGVVAIGQCLHLVLVVAHGSTNLQMPVLQ